MKNETTIDAWREAVEEALGVEPDPKEHTPQWACDVIRAIKMVVVVSERRMAKKEAVWKKITQELAQERKQGA